MKGGFKKAFRDIRHVSFDTAKERRFACRRKAFHP
jgi:hypothetical protein